MVVGKGWTLPAFQFCPSTLCHQAWVHKWGVGLGSRTALTPSYSPASVGSISSTRGALQKTPVTHISSHAVWGLCAVLIPPIHTAHFCWSGEGKFTKAEIKPASRAVWGLWHIYRCLLLCSLCDTWACPLRRTLKCQTEVQQLQMYLCRRWLWSIFSPQRLL